MATSSTSRIVQTSFAGGIMSNDMYGRFDDVKFLSGLKQCQNFVCLPTGPVENRTGFRMVREVKTSAKKTRLIPFTFSSDQTLVLEFGEYYIRFHTNGGTVMNGAVPYEVVTPYTEADLFGIRYAQKDDVVTLVHPNYAPRELKRYGVTNWTLDTITFNESLSAPTNVTAIKFTTAETETNPNAYTFYYKVTALSSNRDHESVGSATASVVANIYNNGTTVKVSWSAVTGAGYYRIYRAVGGVFSYIGEISSSETLELIDDNIEPDSSVTPPRFDEMFSPTSGITSVSVVNGGSGYTCYENGITSQTFTAVTFSRISSYPDLSSQIKDDRGSGAVYTLVSTSWIVPGGEDEDDTYYTRVTGITVTNPGKDYISPKIKITQNGGSSASKSLTTSTVKPTVTFTDATGDGAYAEAIVSSGVVTGFNLMSSGHGYSSPTVTITGTGSGATATATIGTTNDYPSCVTYYEQRRVFANTPKHPQQIVMTKTGTESDLSYSIPTKDDDRIKFEFASNERNAVAHLVPLSRLLVLTEAAEWVITAMNSDAITPTSVGAKTQSYIGASDVRPVVVNNTIVYPARRGGHMRVLAYSYNSSGFTSADISLRATDLFDSKTIKDMCFAKAPTQIVWCVSSDGSLLGMTYIPDQEVYAWHKHTTDGAFESCCTVYEGNTDVLYCVVRRTINGSSKRFVERLEPREFSTQADEFFVDCGATYTGSPTSTITGLNYLEGKKVSILADGCVEPQQTVTNGQITLSSPASKVHVGLPIDAYIETLPATIPQRDNSGGMGQNKNVNSVVLRLKNSSSVFVGAAAGELSEYKQRTTEPLGSPPNLINGDIRMNVKPIWDNSGSIKVVQSNPLPLTVVSFSADIAISG